MVILRQIPQNYLFSKIDLKKLIVPLVIEQFLTIAVGLIDPMMVASVGESAVSAISLVDTKHTYYKHIYGTCNRRSCRCRAVYRNETGA